MDKYAVFGNPIEHSKSPQIHAMFAEQTGHKLNYTRQLVAKGEFKSAADAFFNSGGKGLNITVPFKQIAFNYIYSDSGHVDHSTQLTPRARCAGAVNTLALQANGTLLGDNTDGVGLVNDLIDNLGWVIDGKKVLVLGAGGAVRGCLQPLLQQRPARLIIANRTPAKALELAREFKDLGSVKACGFKDLQDPGFEGGFDLIINGTSMSLEGNLPVLPANLLNTDSHCYDMMYSAEATVFLQWARSQGCRHLADGLGMLVGQAAESFFIWRGVRPSVIPVIKRLRSELLYVPVSGPGRSEL
ncbi:MAG: shikimate dehydrogenase [Exilibacterium sp.]